MTDKEKLDKVIGIITQYSKPMKYNEDINWGDKSGGNFDDCYRRRY